MKILTMIEGHVQGWFEDSRGFAGAHRLRKDYAAATKTLRRATANACDNRTPERQPALDAELVKAQEEASLAQKAVVEYSS